MTSPTLLLFEAQSEGKGKSSKSADDEPVRSELLDYPEQQSTGFIATVSYAGKAVQTSASLQTNADLQAFLASGSWMTLSGGVATAAIAVGSVTLAGGADGTSPVAGAALATALGLIPRELGPGQVLAPGRSTNADQAALLAHAASFNRYAILDSAVSDTTPRRCSQRPVCCAVRHRTATAMLRAPWAVVPGIAPGTLRSVPWSAIQAGLYARNDAAGNPNQAAAGSWGVSQYAVDLVTDFTATDSETLLYAGVMHRPQRLRLHTELRLAHAGRSGRGALGVAAVQLGAAQYGHRRRLRRRGAGLRVLADRRARAHLRLVRRCAGRHAQGVFTTTTRCSATT